MGWAGNVGGWSAGNLGMGRECIGGTYSMYIGVNREILHSWSFHNEFSVKATINNFLGLTIWSRFRDCRKCPALLVTEFLTYIFLV